MSRYGLVVFLSIALFAATQGFSWGRVFNNDEKNSINEREVSKMISKDPQYSHIPMTRGETEIAERLLPDTIHEEREQSFRAARTEEGHEEEKNARFNQGKRLHAEERTIATRPVEAGVPIYTAPTHTVPKTDGDADLHALQKEVSEIQHPLGPDTPPDRVEVVGVPREREHHITDGLADAIAGLMRVYNSLVRSDGREWDTSVHQSMSVGNGIIQGGMNGTEGATVTTERAAQPREKKHSWAPLAVLAGVVVVAAVGVLLVGFANRERESAVYPPRGPAYV